MAPSLVTCPTSTSANFPDFASWISSKLEARTCATVPGALSIEFEPHGLDRVDHHQGRVAGRCEAGGDVAQVDRGGEFQRRVGDAETPGAQAGLLDGFLAGDVEHPPSGACQAGGRLQQQGGLADPRIAADQDRRGRHQPAAQHAIQFGDAGGAARRRFGAAGQVDERDAPCRSGLGGRAGAGGDRLLDDGVPLAAGLAAAGPSRAGRAAALADEAGGRFGQRALGPTRPRPFSVVIPAKAGTQWRPGSPLSRG